MNEEKVLKLPNIPIEKNNPNLEVSLKELISGKKDKSKPREKELNVLISKII
tara:strand:- start:430 stop:585 length:156 start_codon:yes stop_codon:yes gene_type:complete